MRRNRKDNTKKERIIMIASSAFVLTALTMTGVYMQSRDQESENDGYTIDFSALENNMDNKSEEIIENNLGNNILENDSHMDGLADNSLNLEDDLDYLPMEEAGSNLVEIPGLTDGRKDTDETEQSTDTVEEEPVVQMEEPSQSSADSSESTESSSDEQQAKTEQDTLGEDVVVTRELHFAESSGLHKPLAGELDVLIPFSMDSGVYFKTLDHYKRSDAMVISAPEGTAVTACAEGQVIDIFQDAEIGHAVTVDLGDGYRITYGQLRDISVALGSYVNAGDTFAAVAAPTKYYVREGSNLYLQLDANGTAMDPSLLFR